MNKENITIIKEYPAKDYTIINRGTNFQPYVACWLFDKNTYSWGQGHYFDNLEEAIEYVESL